MHADRIRIGVVGTSIERVRGITGRMHVKLLRMVGGPYVAPFITYLGQSNYIGLFLGTLKLSWAL
jgi:hypothetical protein